MDFLFLGLGNPPEYHGTRHNIGKDLVEGLACKDGCKWHYVAKGRVASLLLGPHHITCMVSDGFMNETGQDMREALLEIEPKRLVVVHDEIALPVGSIRLAYNKSPGGHNGVASVAEVLHTNAFFRLRIGVGKDGKDLKKYVLEKIPPHAMDTIVSTVHKTLPGILLNQLPAHEALRKEVS
ncbi:MAG: aminoacyl-tRNA hydrolase [Candidatus Kaiserbacteria bacterium]|nr:aminoacyl-tRNA hydrolase [Candidatus Kaiserbacteria bacterium]